MHNQIILGDCVEIMQTFPAQSIDLIVTDPPYGIQFKSNKQNLDTRKRRAVKKQRPEYFTQIAGDDALPVQWLQEAFRVLKNNSAIYIFCHWSKWHLLFPAVESAGFKCSNMLVLDKSNHGMGDLTGRYAPKHELLLYATKGKHVLNFPDKRQNDVWNVKVRFSGSKRWHPNEKPLEWLRPAIINSSEICSIVLDPFAGSGSTGIAAKLLQRKYILIDIDPDYVNIISTRIKNIQLIDWS
jgi:site-specific DNA-methyltransferase (adenine-specific)